MPKTTWSAFTSPAISPTALPRTPGLPGFCTVGVWGWNRFLLFCALWDVQRMSSGVLASTHQMPRAPPHPHSLCDDEPRLRAVPSVWERGLSPAGCARLLAAPRAPGSLLPHTLSLCSFSSITPGYNSLPTFSRLSLSTGRRARLTRRAGYFSDC